MPGSRDAREDERVPTGEGQSAGRYDGPGRGAGEWGGTPTTSPLGARATVLAAMAKPHRLHGNGSSLYTARSGVLRRSAVSHEVADLHRDTMGWLSDYLTTPEAAATTVMLCAANPGPLTKIETSDFAYYSRMRKGVQDAVGRAAREDRRQARASTAGSTSSSCCRCRRARSSARWSAPRRAPVAAKSSKPSSTGMRRRGAQPDHPGAHGDGVAEGADRAHGLHPKRPDPAAEMHPKTLGRGQMLPNRLQGVAGFRPASSGVLQVSAGPCICPVPIGMAGFEPTTPASQTRCSTKLSYIPYA